MTPRKLKSEADLPSEKRAWLRGHHFTSLETPCLGCGRPFAEVVAEARAASDDVSECPTPHEAADVGQIMNVAGAP